jgi:FkbM family methyltransferase
MSRVFLDVGANIGQTLVAVTALPFDRIYCFEPVSQHWEVLRKLANARTSVEEFGLSNRNGNMPVYDPGSQGASMWAREGRPTTQAVCQFRKASEWFLANIHDGDTVYMKLNCEGAECDILDDLVASGEFDKVAFTLVMFDALKIAALHDTLAATKGRLQAYSKPRLLSSTEIPPNKTHAGRIRGWLRMCGMGEAQ